MEKCCYSLFYDYDSFDMENYKRIYVGDELCDYCFLYHCGEIEQVIRTYIDKKDISILLPVLNELCFQMVEQWLFQIRDQYKNNFELICNDLGSLMYFSKEGFHVVAGRLLTRVVMPYLKNQEENGIQSLVTRVELDATNLKRVRYLKQYYRSYYQMYSLYGHANNRCTFRKVGEGGVITCKEGCYKQKLMLKNTYLDSHYYIVKTAVLRVEEPKNVSGLFDRSIDILS